MVQSGTPRQGYSDDIIFWYNEIRGDPACESSGYYQQFVTMEDGREAHVDIEKIDDRRFVFHYPRIVAEPLLASNMSIMPKMNYEEAKRQSGAEAERRPAQAPGAGRPFPAPGGADRGFLKE